MGMDGLKKGLPFWTSRMAVQTWSAEVCLIKSPIALDLTAAMTYAWSLCTAEDAGATD